MPVHHVKVKADQVDPAQVQQAVAAVRAGQVVVLPTETVYGFAMEPGNAASAERVQELKRRPEEQVFTHHVASAEAARSLAASSSLGATRLMGRYWPGPLTVILPTDDGGTIGLRVPAHPFTRAVLAEFPAGLFMTSVNRTGDEALADPAQIATAFPELDLLCDAGPCTLAQSSAIIRATGERLEILREGTLGRDELLRWSASTCMFVCTGNTCRSPMAEVIARDVIARKLGCAPEELLERGLRIASSGVFAALGSPASPHAITAVEELGLDLSQHRSLPAHPETFGHLARAYTLTESHMHSLLEMAPELRARTSLLDPSGRDIPDPFGGNLETYRDARDAIRAAIESRVDEITGLIG